MTINLLYLKYFHDTIRLGSVSKAAQSNHVTQSAVSQGIAKLEKSLGAKLLTHCRNRIKITAEGEKVFWKSQTVMKSVTELHHCLDDHDNNYHGQLVIACSHSMAQSVLEEPLFEFKKHAPAVRVNVLLGHTGIAKEWIKQGKVEFGLVLDNDDLSQLDQKVLCSGHFNIFQSTNRPDSVPEECIFPESRAEVFDIKRNYRKKFGRELQTSMEINSWEMIASLIEKDLGFGFIPDYLALTPQRAESIKPCDLDLEPIPYNLLIALPKGEELSRNAKLFVEILQEKIRNMK